MRIARLIAALAVALASCPANADDWPTRPIRIIAPSTPGGAADLFARLLCEHFSTVSSQGCTVDNRAGAGGAIGTAAAAQAEPDGTTLTVSSLAYHVIAPGSRENAGYDPIKSFTHIAYLGGPANVFVGNPKAGLKGLADVTAQARKSGPLAYVSPGVGTLGHLLVEAFAAKEKFPVQLILTKGASQAMNDLVAGNVAFGSMTWTSALGQLRSNLVTPIAVSSRARLPEFPDLPTFRDLGHDDLTAVSWFGLSAPAGLPAPMMARFNREVGALLQKPDVIARFQRDAIESRTMTPDEYTAFVKAETDRWGPLARQLATPR